MDYLVTNYVRLFYRSRSEHIDREAFKYYLDIMVTLCPHRAKFLALSEYASHTALEHYSGGCPVPRAPSLSQRQAYTNTLSSVYPLGNYPSFCLLLHLRTTKSQGLVAIFILSGSG
jgi:hypothetical protein